MNVGVISHNPKKQSHSSVLHAAWGHIFGGYTPCSLWLSGRVDVPCVQLTPTSACSVPCLQHIHQSVNFLVANPTSHSFLRNSCPAVRSYRDLRKLIVMEFSLFSLLWTSLLAWIGLGVVRIVYNIFFHPLREFPGTAAAKATTWWQTYIEVVKQESMTDVLKRLHKQYGAPFSHFPLAPAKCIPGDIVRIGPNEVCSAKLYPVLSDFQSFISQNRLPIMRSIVRQHAGTKKGYCMKRLEKTTHLSVSSPTPSRSNGKMCCNRFSLDEQSSICNRSLEKQ
jgi:hypothetical protein